ncbi:MAG: hypothetical protein L0L58_10575 [Tetragenococcus koreensis]|nr:hypothetical protein [Tetragenococcus koreensis]
MKNKIITTMSTLFMFIPWTILPLRMFDWALEQPQAETIIISYAVFMIFSGVFTLAAYSKDDEKNNLMKICLVINSLYLMFGILVLGLNFYK